jgi:hypothetical protein
VQAPDWLAPTKGTKMMTDQSSIDATGSNIAPPRKARPKKASNDRGSDRPPKSRIAKAAISKAEQILKKLGSAKGVTIPQMMETTGWQAHSVRGFLSGVVRKKLGHVLVSELGKDGLRRYRIIAGSTSAEA